MLKAVNMGLHKLPLTFYLQSYIAQIINEAKPKFLKKNKMRDKMMNLINVLMRIRTTPHQEDNSPPYRFWSWWVVLFRGSGPSGELSWWGIVVLGIVVLVGNGWALFLSGGELFSWGVVLEPY